ncbi:class I SAM-dependent methyltransferase [Nocardia jinanensis]|uniref:Methyltransferase n=1 Tax=Nocardia jinanensis TaxID=382504 RepID=A0A917RSU2_9NOCA|nr:class I SAM-dependent methyltransferase [Nocardia jinanensis]GGL26061.1 methyltransferase [Nocardia jinanensis]
MTESCFLSRTRAGYDAIATAYAEHAEGEMEKKFWDRAVLTAFAESVGDRGPVADIGCGPGRIAGFLAARGTRVHGVDLSPAMVAVARERFPDIDFEVGSMTALDIADGTRAGVVAWYSLIHIPPHERGGVLAEFRRVLRPEGKLLLAFQTGTDILHLDEGYGQAISLDFHRLSIGELAGALEADGFTIDLRVERRAEDGERAPQGYLMLTRSS